MSRTRVNPWILENRITNSMCDSAFIALLEMKIWIRKFQFLTETSLGSWNFVLEMTTTKETRVVGFFVAEKNGYRKLKTIKVLHTSFVEVGGLRWLKISGRANRCHIRHQRIGIKNVRYQISKSDISRWNVRCKYQNRSLKYQNSKHCAITILVSV